MRMRGRMVRAVRTAAVGLGLGGVGLGVGGGG